MKTCLEQVQKFYPNVKTVVDGTRAAKVIVMPQDLRGSKRKAPNACAMARACTREFSLDGAVIRPSVAYFVRGNKATRYRVPQSIYREIVSFDRHGDFRPGEYQLTRIESSHALGRRQGGPDKKRRNKMPKRRNGAVRAYRHRTLGIRQV